MKLNRKGFTLIELLVTIVVVGLVVGLSVFGIVKLIGNAEEKTNVISINNMKEAARIYSSEASSDSWKKNDKYDYDAFCVTIGELMNKGLLDKNATINGGYNRDSYVIVKRNKITLAIETEDMVPIDEYNENNEICTGQNVVEDVTSPVIGYDITYTNRIEIPFTAGEAPESSIKNYTCLYGESSSNVNREGVIEGNKCVLDGLKNSKNYYVLIYMNTNMGSSVLATGKREYNTADFVNTNVIQVANEVTIDYEDDNIYGSGYHYFKSGIDGSSDVTLEKCNYNNNRFSCSGSYNKIEADTWYRVDDNSLNITYSEENNTFRIDTKICDDSNNCHDNSKDITINKYTVRFYRNGAKEIDRTTNDYIERYCIAGNNESCMIMSLEIVAPDGYNALGWNTDMNADSSIWDMGADKEINSDMEYYAIYKAYEKGKVNIKYNVNGGSIGKSQNYSGTWTSDSNGIVSNDGDDILDAIEYGSALTGNGLLNYNNADYLYIVRSGYKAVSGSEWKCLSGNCKYETYSQKPNYNASEFCDASNGDCTVILGVNWTKKNSTVTTSPTLSGSEKCKQACIEESYAEDEYCYYNLVCYCCPTPGDTPCKVGGGVTGCITVHLD